MKKSKKMYYLAMLGAFFFLAGVVISLDYANGRPFVYFGIGTWAATGLYYGIMARHPEITAFIIGLIILHTGVLLIFKGNLSYPEEFGLVTFVSGILVLLNSGFSVYMRKLKKKK